MRILFVISHLFYNEPLGAMLLSSACRKAGHATKLAVLSQKNLLATLDAFQPDIVAYSAMSADEGLFRQADQTVKDWIAQTGRKVLRIMGGPHPTFFPDALDNFGLDAICIGDGDHAMIRMLKAVESGQPMDGIPNVLTPNFKQHLKEIVEDLDSLPFADRALIYDADPGMQRQGIRSFLTQKGCPFKCTYCFNHAFNSMFKGDGRKLIRRRSIDNLFAEIKQVQRDWPEMRYVRFADDVFAIKRDAWLEEFALRYPKEIGVPFYCLIRANTLTDDMAELLAKAGCRSIAMSIESGLEDVRNLVLKRNMTDEMMLQSFATARKYGLNAFANTILGIPGTTLEDDFRSYRFAKRLKAAAPTFSIFCPYPGTELTDYAKEIGVLPPDLNFNEVNYWTTSVLNNYTEDEKVQMYRLMKLAPIFSKLPQVFDAMLPWLCRLPLTGLYSVFGTVFHIYLLGGKIFPRATPLNPLVLLKEIGRSFIYIFKGA
ncbi:MAG: B12-binding domain-containing radical SAM protein [Rhodospirillales bacterium]|nr:MAG: B12-binding domain-containing radical SAM protein [Rhodospirillales bacterium]